MDMANLVTQPQPGHDQAQNPPILVDFLFCRNAELVRVFYKNIKHRNLRLREFCICNSGRLGQTNEQSE